jgi:hypothetical protein
LLAALAVVAGLALLVYSIATVIQGPRRPSTPIPTPQPRPEIALNPTQGYAGTYVTVVGRYWQPGEMVHIYLSPPLAREEAYAYEGSEVDPDGAFIVSIIFPDDSRLISRGSVAVVASSDSGQEAAAPFRLRRPTPVAPTPSPTPTPKPTAQPSATPTFTPAAPTPTLVPTPAPTRTFSGWRGEYYDNPNLAGDPKLIRDDETIDFRWTVGSPDPAIPADDFSVRWTRTVPLAAGTYHFRVRADDGCRLWVDGALLIDQWKDSSETIYSGSAYLAQGQHPIMLEYYERAGGATVALWWEYEDAFPNWKGEYFSNTALSGTPTLVRDDEQADFAWGLDAPDPSIPADGFSARWTRKWWFVSGSYRFYAKAKDGIRVWFDDTLIIDEWHTGTNTTYAGDVQVSEAAYHTVRISYYHQSGQAEIKVMWEALATFTGWKGEYFSNKDLRGQPVFVRNDANVDFEWGLASPGSGIGKDEFSVRWTRELEFASGDYVFSITVDDGARVWLDDWKVLDQWQDGIRRTYTAGFEGLSGGRHTLRAEYYENVGEATIRFSWTQQATQPLHQNVQE